MPRSDDQDPLTPAAADQLGQDHPDLQGLAEPNGVGQQDPRTEVLRIEGLSDGRELIGQAVGEPLGRDREGRISDGHGGLARHRFQP